MLDYENAANPYPERRQAVTAWQKHAAMDVEPSRQLVDEAKTIQHTGIKPKDALHLACAISAECDYFLTTDKGILNKSGHITQTRIVNPIDCIDYLEQQP